jgi:hypothetical protein
LVIGVYRSDLAPVYFYFGALGLAVAGIILCNLYACLIRMRRAGSLLAVRFGYESGDGWFKRFLRFAHYWSKRDFMAFFALFLAIIGQLQIGLIIFGSLATLMLLPASIKVNLESWLLVRRTRRAAGATSQVPQGTGWFPAARLVTEAAVAPERTRATEVSQRR